MRAGFIGLGNVGAKLAGSSLRNGTNLTVRDLDRSATQHLLDAGATWGESPAAMTEQVDLSDDHVPAQGIGHTSCPSRQVYTYLCNEKQDSSPKTAQTESADASATVAPRRDSPRDLT